MQFGLCWCAPFLLIMACGESKSDRSSSLQNNTSSDVASPSDGTGQLSTSFTAPPFGSSATTSAFDPVSAQDTDSISRDATTVPSSAAFVDTSTSDSGGTGATVANSTTVQITTQTEGVASDTTQQVSVIETTTGAGSTTASSSTTTFGGKELFLLFGQSNMSGSAPVEAQDKTTNENISFMVEYDCPSLNQSYGEWLVAEPPLHGCQWTNNGVLGLGPADYFAKTLAQSWTESRIGLVPCAIPGVSIDVFLKGGGPPPESYQALPEGFTSAYTMMVERAKEAQKEGRIRGILFHQGESNCGQSDWVSKVASIVDDLRADLSLGEDVPFIAGEIPPQNSCSQSHNPKVNELPSAVPNSAVVSAQGTTIHDQYHFDSLSVRLMGERYAEAFLQLVPVP